MSDLVNDSVRSRGIDSFQKLRFLLFFHQNPTLKGTSHELAERLFFGDVWRLQEILAELQATGLVECVDNCYRLRDRREVREELQHLARAFDHPLTRQSLLDQVQRKAGGRKPQPGREPWAVN